MSFNEHALLRGVGITLFALVNYQASLLSIYMFVFKQELSRHTHTREVNYIMESMKMPWMAFVEECINLE